MRGWPESLFWAQRSLPGSPRPGLTGVRRGQLPPGEKVRGRSATPATAFRRHLGDPGAFWSSFDDLGVAAEKQGQGCLHLDWGPLSRLSLVSAVQWQGVSTEGLRGTWAGTGSLVWTDSHDFAFTSKEFLPAAARHRPSPPLHSLACPLNRLLLVTAACGHNTLWPSRRGQPSLFFLHLAPRGPLRTTRLPWQSQDHPSRDSCG